MNITYEMIEIVKSRHHVKSDYAAAKIIGVKPQKISNWKAGQSEANGINLLKIIIEAGLTAEDALNLITKKATDQANTTGGNSANVYYVKLLHILQSKLLRFAFQNNIKFISV